MTVSELISILEKYPPGYIVLVDGYEGDFDNVNSKEIRVVSIVSSLYNDGYSGEFKEGQSPVNALIIPR